MRNAGGEFSHPVQHNRLSVLPGQVPSHGQSAVLIKAHAHHSISNNHLSVSLLIFTHLSISLQGPFRSRTFTMQLSILLSVLAGTAAVSAAPDVFGAVRGILCARLDQQ